MRAQQIFDVVGCHVDAGLHQPFLQHLTHTPIVCVGKVASGLQENTADLLLEGRAVLGHDGTVLISGVACHSDGVVPRIPDEPLAQRQLGVGRLTVVVQCGQCGGVVFCVTSRRRVA